MFKMDDLDKMDYMPEVPHDIWSVKWKLETPSEGGRILASDPRSTVVYQPNCSPYNEDEQRLARLFLHSREMKEMLSRCIDVLDDNGEWPIFQQSIQKLLDKVEGK